MNEPLSRSTGRRLAIFAVCLAGAMYLLQIGGPLRLNNDVDAFLTLARSARQGLGFTYQGQATHFPPGYPAVIALLDAAGGANAVGLILLNLIALAIGLWAWQRLQEGRSAGARRRASTPAAACGAGLEASPHDPSGAGASLAPLVATLYSWPMLKHAMLPVSESLYAAISLGALALFHAAMARVGRARLAWLAGGTLLMALAISVRAIGIALLPAWVLACLPPGALTRLWQWGSAHTARIMLGVTALLGALALGGYMIIRYTRYGAEMLVELATREWRLHVVARLRDLGEIAVNLPSSKLPPGVAALVPAAGVLLTLLVLAGIWRSRRLTPTAIYLVMYAGILAIWPYADPRFWVPVLPVLSAFAIAGVRPCLRNPPWRTVARLYVAAFLLAGLASGAYTTRVTFAGAQFPERYAGGALAATYRAHLGVLAPANDTSVPNPHHLVLLRHFDPEHAAPTAPAAPAP